MDLKQFDETFGVQTNPRPTVTAHAAPPAGGISAPTMPNGYFTLTFPDGSHKTFRVHTKRPDAKFAPGKRIVSLLIGPDNTEDYEGFAFLEEDGIKVWKRFKGAKQEKYAGILWMMAAEGREADGHELSISKRCYVCNRTLTDPESIRLGIGPLCRERLGM